MTTMFDSRLCLLGEGPLWHPECGQLFWFDILGKKLLSQKQGGALEWRFDDHVSAAGWIDQDRLLIASVRSLFVFNPATGEQRDICTLEADRTGTRSNDGRTDTYGGFWISTMGKSGEKGQARIYRFYRGEVRQLYESLTIPNAICFSHDGRLAYFADTAQHKLFRVNLDRQGWPCGEPEIFLDFNEDKRNPDGAVIDQSGNIWIAFWGASSVDAYGFDGALSARMKFPTSQVSCPAFGGETYSTLFVTSARVDLSASALAAEPDAGAVFASETAFQGLPEYKVIL